VPRPSRRWVLIGTGALVLAAGVWIGREAVIARNALLDASDQARTLQGQISDGKAEAATVTLTSLQASTGDARTHTDGPLWAALTATPFVGKSVDATRVVSSSLDDIAQRAIPPVVEVSSSLDANVFRPKNGRFDLAALQALAPSVTEASVVLAENEAVISAIDADDLVGSVRRPIIDLQGKVADAEFAASSAARGMQLAPSMLGAEGKRKYLLLFQNNAEVRSTGGLPGAWTILRANRGKITFGRQGSGTDIRRFARPVVDLTEEELDVYGELMATDFRDTNFTPEFSRTAEIARAMVRKELDVDVDGVFSVDPVALRYLLKATGPIKASRDTVLTNKNAVDILLNQVYARFRDPLAQDTFFADSARRIFDAVIAGKGDARTTLRQLVKASDEHRILMWSADAEEQASLGETRVAGVFRGVGSPQPQVGVYLNDSTESKMQYYLDARSTARAVSCDSEGAQSIRLTTTFRSTAPADASALPKYITGFGNREARGNMLLDTRFFGPAGGRFTSFTVNDERRTLSGREFKGRPVNIGAFRIKPGQSVRVVATMVTQRGDDGDAVLNVTPGAHPTKNGIRIASAC
jgi:hypothetical protein